MNHIDKKIAELQQTILEKKKHISKTERPTYITNGLIDLGVVKKNLQVITNVDELIKTYSLVKHAYVIFEDAAKELGVSHTHETGLHPLSDWTHDFKQRLACLQVSMEKAKLQKMEKTLMSLESDEVKRIKTLQQIEEDLA